MRLIKTLASIVLLIGAINTYAGSFNVTPVRLIISPNSQTTSTLVTNLSDQPLQIQTQIMSWGQVDGEDRFEPTNNLVSSPPIFKIPAKGVQTLRIGLLKPFNGNSESAYRVFVQEVPQEKTGKGVNININLQMVLPLFVLPQGPVSPSIRWHLIEERDGNIYLSLDNLGNQHLQLIECKLLPSDGSPITSSNISGYVLPGTSRKWQIGKRNQLLSRGRGITILAKTDNGDIRKELIVE